MTLELAAHATTEIVKQHPMRETTIRVPYPGVHWVELQVNGTRDAESRFTLV